MLRLALLDNVNSFRDSSPKVLESFIYFEKGKKMKENDVSN